ncbi:predicted protein [Uncinocarpus reesii 1704]|uniref:Uncharacterized protein n=1 Tax=Uncinocarpus reesii (strain UAMH 1704) TaxID=336963 RepID=C4JIH9_UNCRE|nr:uncharacterized protein UREG_01516 [Uncinocarpus reesii 1704]EEP76667.1 predicted protein [Uncinocarpus reesii 1704]
MVEYIPAPDPRSLLPPLLACLPAGFASPRPPPPLIPLLSPILRQRIQLLSSVSPSSSDSWLRLLCWNPERGQELERIVGETTFEPHPVSDVSILKRYGACFLLAEYNLAVVYVWCPGDREGGDPGWRVTEVLPLRSPQGEEAHTWASSITEANEVREPILHEALADAEHEAGQSNGVDGPDDNDDDDYWAQYDDNLGRTPVRNASPHLAHSRVDVNKQPQEASDASYYGRYDEVQPAMDHDDPSVDRSGIGSSSLDGEAVSRILRQQMEHIVRRDGRPRTPPPDVDACASSLNHPRPESASSRGSDAVLRLEQTAENQSLSEMGVRDYISSSIRNLHQLARTTGISGDEFGNLVRNELDLLE